MNKTIEEQKERLIMNYESLLDFYIQVQSMTDPANYAAGMKVFERRKKELDDETKSLLARSEAKKWWEFWK